MKKKMNKKGFTIVELVIVIAVIAILAAVLIPTFTGVINAAHESAALQEATASYKDAYAVALADDGVIDETSVTAGGVTWTITEGAWSSTSEFGNGYTASVSAAGVVTVTKGS